MDWKIAKATPLLNGGAMNYSKDTSNQYGKYIYKIIFMWQKGWKGNHNIIKQRQHDCMEGKFGLTIVY